MYQKIYKVFDYLSGKIACNIIILTFGRPTTTNDIWSHAPCNIKNILYPTAKTNTL